MQIIVLNFNFKNCMLMQYQTLFPFMNIFRLRNSFIYRLMHLHLSQNTIKIFDTFCTLMIFDTFFRT